MNLRTDRPRDARCDSACCSTPWEIRYAPGATELNPDELRLCGPHYRDWLDELEHSRAEVAREQESEKTA